MGLLKKTKKDSTGREADRYGGLDLLRDILSCAAIMILAGGWAMLCLLIMSFVFIHYIPFHLNWMIPVAIVVGVSCGAGYIYSRVTKLRQKRVNGDGSV